MSSIPLRLPAPAAGEFNPYYGRYVEPLEGRDAAGIFADQPDRLDALCGRLDEQGAGFRYAPGKWSIREVIGHISDTERVFAYRLLRFARNDPTPLPGFDENLYVANAGFDSRPIGELVDGFRHLRASTRALLLGLDAAAWERRGTANEDGVTVRALAYLIPAHAEHHLRLLVSRYGLSETG